MNFPLNASELIPHRGAMLLLNQVTSFTADLIEGKTMVDSRNPFLRETAELSPVCAVELLAQLAAASHRLQNASPGPPRMGYLVKLKDFQLQGNSHLGDELHLAVQIKHRIGQSVVLQGEVLRESESIARGELQAQIVENDVPSHSTLESAYPETATPFEAIIRKRIELLSNIGNTIEASLELPREFPALQGHFPGDAIVPGALLIEICRLASGDLRILRIDQAKFLRKVVPGDSLKIRLLRNSSMTRAQIFLGEIEAARVDMILEEPAV